VANGVKPVPSDAFKAVTTQSAIEPGGT